MSLLVVLTLSVVHAARRHAYFSEAAVEHARVRELADSALRLWILRLGSPSSEASSNETSTLEVFGQPVQVSSQFESGRIDLNAADELLLAAAFAAHGYAEEDAFTMAARIVDWRDIDDVASEHGAEREDYRRAGRSFGPRNGSFSTVTEVQQVLGGERIDADLLDVFTIYSQLPQVRQDVATPAVERVLRWAQERHWQDHEWWRAEQSMHNSRLSDLAGQAMQLQACINAKAKICRNVIVRFTGNRTDPVLIYAWR